MNTFSNVDTERAVDLKRMTQDGFSSGQSSYPYPPLILRTSLSCCKNVFKSCMCIMIAIPDKLVANMAF